MKLGVNRQDKVNPGKKIKPGVNRQDKVKPGEKWNQE